jgi:hypothetical protein
MWYTLIRFKGSPADMTGVSQTKTAAEALTLLESWEAEYPEDTTVVFDPQNAPLQRASLEMLAVHQPSSDAAL